MRILIISTVGLKYEGITSVILENMKAMNKMGLDIYVVGTIEIDSSIAEEIQALHCTLVELPNRKTDTVGYFKGLIRCVRTNKIDVVHAHGNSATLAIEMLAAFLGGCKHRIAHSHNTRCEQVRADRLLRPLFYMFCNEALACGKDAGKWLFRKHPFRVISNGRDIEKYQYDTAVRERMRKEHHLEDKVVIGHVGGFLAQKNHTFLIDIFQEILKKERKAYLVLIGGGELRIDIEQKVQQMGIGEHVLFAGLTNHVSDWLQAMDGMLLPSLFEGLPLVAVEWQMAGLPSVLSDHITKECAFTDQIRFCSLEEKPEVWADQMLDAIRAQKREGQTEQIRKKAVEAGFDIKDNAEKLRTIYLEEK